MFTDTCSASSTGAHAAAAAAVEVAAAAGAVVARTRAPSRRPGLPAAGGCMVQPRTPGRRAAHGSAGARRRLCAPRDGSPPSYGYIRSLMKGANEMNLARACLGNSGFRNIPIYMGSHGAERSESQGSTSIRHHSQRQRRRWLFSTRPCVLVRAARHQEGGRLALPRGGAPSGG